ncbi:MAG: hypothetical protein H6881_00575 [Rhodobiaceae bacterium]|nr:hypothetical protein [Hyphomonas sp.]MCB9970043.1 hypothetical protein [Hyphomonas sp.]MCC0050344.1 hypothetical protein [Rhodobiaceae bacterium]
MTDATSQSSGQVRDFFRTQMTTGAQYGLIALAGLVGICGLRTLAADVDQLRSRSIDAASELQMLNDTTAETVWQERANQAQTVARAWDAQMLSAPSAGVGAAQLEVMLRDIARSSEISDLQVNINPDLVDRNAIAFLRFDISGQMIPGQTYALLAALATSKPTLIVTDLQIAPRSDGQMTLKVSGISPFRQIEERP